MKIFKFSLIGLLSCILLFACSKEDVAPSNDFVIIGEINKNDSTFIQLGTHVIQDFGIESSTIELDDYLNQTITIFGKMIDGNDKHIEIIEVRQ